MRTGLRRGGHRRRSFRRKSSIRGHAPLKLSELPDSEDHLPRRPNQEVEKLELRNEPEDEIDDPMPWMPKDVVARDVDVTDFAGFRQGLSKHPDAPNSSQHLKLPGLFLEEKPEEVDEEMKRRLELVQPRKGESVSAILARVSQAPARQHFTASRETKSIQDAIRLAPPGHIDSITNLLIGSHTHSGDRFTVL
jgi:hypothetical protein